VVAKDTDGIPDAYDNCSTTDNADQLDTDGDEVGDACEEDEPPPIDTEAPTIADRAPAPGAVEVLAGSTIDVTLSEPVAPASVTAATVFLKKGTTKVPATVTASGSSLTLDPTKKLKAGMRYTVTVVGGPDGVTDVAGNPLAGTTRWSFTVNAVPTIAVLSPAPGSTTRDRTPKITFEVGDESSIAKASVALTVDGTTSSFGYKKGIGRLSPKLSKGKHTVVVSATDRVGVMSTKSWSFTVK
jgi:Bacterial Ig-like domain/Thrombospondin type 3 repeat